MPIPQEYRPLIDTAIHRSRSGTAKWMAAVIPGEAYQVVGRHSVLIRHSDPSEGEAAGLITVRVLDSVGNFVYCETVQSDDPDFALLNELDEMATRELARQLESTATNPA